jgi:quercetin dioxygenase-like cupin family protein
METMKKVVIIRSDRLEEEPTRHGGGVLKRVILRQGAIPRLNQLATARFREGDFVPKHRHADMVEVFFLLDGEATLCLEGEERPILPEDTVVVYPGVLHGFRIVKPSRLLYFSLSGHPDAEAGHPPSS